MSVACVHAWNKCAAGAEQHGGRAATAQRCTRAAACELHERARQQRRLHGWDHMILFKEPRPLPLLVAEDELRASGVPFAVVRPVALTEEPEGMPLVLDQGDTMKGKVGAACGVG